jgi:hypothetical protein
MSDVDKARDAVKITYYKGVPTRKYRRYLRMERGLEDAFIGMSNYLDKSIKNTK